MGIPCMRVIHLNTYDTGGAAIAALRLHRGLMENGVGSEIVVMEQPGEHPEMRALESKKKWLTPGRRRHLPCSQHPSAFRRRHRSWLEERKVESINSAFSDWAGSLASSLPADADILHLHWVSGFLDYRDLVILSKKFRLVWTFHDMHPMLGVTHYPEPEWPEPKVGEACPFQVPVPSRQALQRKQEAYRRIAPQNLSLIAPSQWMQEQMKAAPALTPFTSSHIPNGIDAKDFSPGDKHAARNQLGLPQVSTLALLCADSLDNPRKGMDLFCNALRLLSKEILEQITPVVIGDISSEMESQIPVKISSLGRVDDWNQLVMAYRAADFFVIPSRLDNFPNTVLEAMACGCPILANGVGGVSEMVKSGSNGWQVAQNTPEAFAAGIQQMVHGRDRWTEWGARSRERVENSCTLEHQVECVVDLYRKTLSSS